MNDFITSISFKKSNIRTQQQLYWVKQKIQLDWSLSKKDKKRASICGAFPRLSFSLQPFVLSPRTPGERCGFCVFSNVQQEFLSLICPALPCNIFCRTHLTPAKLCILNTWIGNSLGTAHPFVPDCSLFSTLIHD